MEVCQGGKPPVRCLLCCVTPPVAPPVYPPSSSNLMSLAACIPSSFRFFSICLLRARLARSSALMAQPMMMACRGGRSSLLEPGPWDQHGGTVDTVLTPLVAPRLLLRSYVLLSCRTLSHYGANTRWPTLDLPEEAAGPRVLRPSLSARPTQPQPGEISQPSPGGCWQAGVGGARGETGKEL